MSRSLFAIRHAAPSTSSLAPRPLIALQQLDPFYRTAVTLTEYNLRTAAGVKLHEPLRFGNSHVTHVKILNGADLVVGIPDETGKLIWSKAKTLEASRGPYRKPKFTLDAVLARLTPDALIPLN